MKNKVIFISAGGTGGHIFPALILSDKLKKQGYQLYFITDKRGIKFITNQNKDNIFNKIYIIPASGFSGKNLFKKFMSLLNVCAGFFISMCLILKYKPKLTIGFGGYTTVPVIIGSKILLKRTIIHSADTVFGLSNKVLSFFANKICVSFKEVLNIPQINCNKVIFTALPINDDFYKLSSKPYVIDNNKINILITGGSLGAVALSVPVASVIANLPQYIKNKLYIFHQVNIDSLSEVKRIYKNSKINATVDTFFNNTSELLYKCNLFIGRAGASTVYEIMTIKRPSIFIPLLHKDRHQIINAEFLEKVGASIIILQNYDFMNSLNRVLVHLLSDTSKLKLMHQNLQKIKTYKAIPRLLKVVNEFME